MILEVRKSLNGWQLWDNENAIYVGTAFESKEKADKYLEEVIAYRQLWDNSKSTEADTVNRPKHYNSHPSGVECIEITEHFNFNIGNAIKYLWRSGRKNNELEDLRKAEWYVKREIERIEKQIGK